MGHCVVSESDCNVGLSREAATCGDTFLGLRPDSVERIIGVIGLCTCGIGFRSLQVTIPNRCRPLSLVIACLRDVPAVVMIRHHPTYALVNRTVINISFLESRMARLIAN